jgi:hypothetical protein
MEKYSVEEDIWASSKEVTGDWRKWHCTSHQILFG